MASSKAVEEKNLKIIRELMRLPANKTCFDCTQKVSKYLNWLKIQLIYFLFVKRDLFMLI